MTEESQLKYIDAEDKCFGVAGMAIALVIFNSEDKLISVSIDRNDLDSIEFSPEVCFPENSGISPKVVWKHLLEHFQLVSALLISNMMCRTMVHRHIAVSSGQRREMLDILKREDVNNCDLEGDEIDLIFRKNFEYLQQAFSSSSVNYAAKQMAKELSKRRQLSHSEILEILSVRSRF